MLLSVLQTAQTLSFVTQVIIRYEGKITLYCKGADSVIFERLSSSLDPEVTGATQEHLNKFAGEGLRTLCLAKKDLDVVVYDRWRERYHEAVISLDNREEKVSAVYEEIEQQLVLVGTTAIEDKLQDGVPQCIANLAAANIKLWVLTGDKQETAINIGYSCQLLTDEMVDVFTIEGWDYDEVEQELQRCRESINNLTTHAQGAPNCSVVFSESGSSPGSVVPPDSFPRNASINNNNSRAGLEAPPGLVHDTSGGFALVVNGHSLVQALVPSMELLFLEVASSCKAVICCRVTPLQKALVVDLVKRHKKAVTLAIGDGANDVSMIKSEFAITDRAGVTHSPAQTVAHIGVGISGQEGMQAVLSSDYSIAQFRYLERLLLVHGRWSYYRMCRFLRYFFYKNFSFTLCHFWYAFFCGFSAQVRLS